MPRLASRKTCRNNVPATSALEYYYRSVYMPFIDNSYCLFQMREEFKHSTTTRACKLQLVSLVKYHILHIVVAVRHRCQRWSGVSSLATLLEVWVKHQMQRSRPSLKLFVGVISCVQIQLSSHCCVFLQRFFLRQPRVKARLAHWSIENVFEK